MNDETTDDGLPARLLVPWDRLSPSALRGVIDEYVTREGTEHGFDDVPLEEKVRDVQRLLERGEVVVLFDRESGTTNLVTEREARLALAEEA